MKRLVGILAVVVSVFSAGLVGAMDFGSALSVAVENVPPGADSAGMGNAWTATPQFSSNNPAVMAMDEKLYIGGSATGERIFFADGPEVNIASGSLVARILTGLFQFTYSQAGSEWGRVKDQSANMEGHVKFDRIQSLDFQYGQRLAADLFRKGDKLFAGIGYAYTTSELRALTFVGTPATTFEFNLESETRDHTWSGGVVYQPLPAVTLGAYYATGRSRTRDESLFEKEIESVEKFRGFSEKWRFGGGWQATKRTFLTADFQHLNLDGVKKDQLFAGLEQGIWRDVLYLYAGWAGSGPTVGVGFYLPNGGVNVGYMRRPFDDLDQFLGHSQVLAATAYVNF